jgi:lactate permease
MLELPSILSISPFFLFVVLLFWRKMSLIKVSAITLLLITTLAFFYWKIFPFLLLSSYIKGLFIALDIFIIIFGAILFFETLRRLKIIDNIAYHLKGLSGDYRVQIIILAWFLENFIEGTAGFGTPVMVVAPLLIGMGLPVIRALTIALLGNSASVVFGAAGAPIRIGFAGLDITSVPVLSATINCVGFVVPIFILWLATADRAERKREFIAGLPFAILSGIVFVGLSLSTVFLGQEFPSILGSLLGMFLIFLLIKLGLFIPKKSLSLREEKKPEHTLSAFQSFLPYGALIIFLIIGKFTLGNLGIPISLGAGHVFNLFNPGFAFILASLLTVIIWRGAKSNIFPDIKRAFIGAINPFLVIASMSAVVQIMVNSSDNMSGLPGAITLIAHNFETTLLPFFAPFVGAFGSFITGSATISNIMFGYFFSTAAQVLNFNVAIILSLGVVGAAAGNMIALADILAGEAVMGVKNKEREVLRGVFIPCLTYLILIGLVGVLIT